MMFAVVTPVTKALLPGTSSNDLAAFPESLKGSNPASQGQALAQTRVSN